MAGSSVGIVTGSLIGARVTRNLIFVPPYVKPGTTERVKAKVYIPVAINPLKGEPSYYTLTLWGDKVAPLFAWNVRKGKEMHFIDAEFSTFKANMTTKEGTQLFNNDATPATYDRLSITVRKFLWGADSADMIAQEALIAQAEIAQGKRPANWNVQGHPERTAWLNHLRARAAVPYTGGPTYGYADVSKKSIQHMVNANAHMINNMGGGMVDANASVPNVGGMTYDRLKNEFKMTDEAIAAHPLYGVLKVAHDLMASKAAAPIWTPGAPANTGAVWTPPPPVNAGAGAGAGSFY